MSGYNPAFDLDFRRGQVGEKLVGTFLESVGGSRIEVKTDYRVWDTGNVYVETWQQGRDGLWKPSGIDVSESDWYAFAGPMGSGFVAITHEALADIARRSPKRTIAKPNINTVNTYGRLVAVADIVEAIFRKE